MRYEMVYFDLDNTLLDFSRSEKESLRYVFSRYGLELNNEEVELYTQINKKWWQDFSKGLYSKDHIVIARFKEFLEKIGATNIPVEKISTEYLDKLSQTAYFVPGARQFLEKMKLRNQRMAILTNGVRKVQEARAKILGLQNYVEFIITSEQVQKPKPDPAMFSLAAQLSGVRLDRSVYVGDDPVIDYQASRNAGVDFIIFDPSGANFSNQFPVVKDFDELYAALCL